MTAITTIVAPFVGCNISFTSLAEDEHTLSLALTEDLLALLVFHILVHSP